MYSAHNENKIQYPDIDMCIGETLVQGFSTLFLWSGVALHAHLHRLDDKAVDFTLLHHNNARSGKIYAEFSIGAFFPLGY